MGKRGLIKDILRDLLETALYCSAVYSLWKGRPADAALAMTLAVIIRVGRIERKLAALAQPPVSHD